MIEFILFLVLNIIGIVFMLLILEFKHVSDDSDETGGWDKIAFLAAVISAIIWIVCAVACVDLGYTESYAVLNGESVETGSFMVQYTGTWMFSMVYVLVSVIPFVLLFGLFPATWQKIKIRW